MTSIGFTGSRRGMTDKQKIALRNILTTGTEFHHGDCVGSDEQAHYIAKSLGLFTVIHPPSESSMRAWCEGDEVMPEKSYLTRNRDIVSSCDFLVAAPAEEIGEKVRSGTWATVRNARASRKKVFILRPSGLVETA